jgi:hypothetical protein
MPGETTNARIPGMELEKPHSARASTNGIATIRTDDTSFIIPCVVCNLSGGGAKHMVEERNPLPTEFIRFLRERLAWPLLPDYMAHRQQGWRSFRVGSRLDHRSHRGSGVWAPE